MTQPNEENAGAPAAAQAAPAVIALPSPGRAALYALLGAGVLLGGAGVAVLLGGGPPALGLLLLGFGLGFGGVTAAVLANREAITHLRLDPAARQITVCSSDGSSAQLGFDLVARVDAVACTSSSEHGTSVTGATLALHKKDGGVLELARFSELEQARAAAERVEQALRRGDAGAASEPGAPEDRFASSPAVRASREGDALRLSWATRGSLAIAAAVAVAFGAMALIAYAFYLYSGKWTTLAASAATILLGALVVGFALRDAGARQSVRIDGRELTMERSRRGKVVESRALSIWSVIAVDYSHRLDVLGACLLIRTRPAQDAHEQIEQQAERMEESGGELGLREGIGLAQGVLALLRSGIQLPLGRLSLAERVNLDLAISEELARRTGKEARRI
ncbi:MAG: hypothetical protein HY744_16070 [Deltaproteobacteria bacterium]|nr:hypothetical protein [Deltaproteobacteria bacterium]